MEIHDLGPVTHNSFSSSSHVSTHKPLYGDRLVSLSQNGDSEEANSSCIKSLFSKIKAIITWPIVSLWHCIKCLFYCGANNEMKEFLDAEDPILFIIKRPESYLKAYQSDPDQVWEKLLDFIFNNPEEAAKSHVKLFFHPKGDDISILSENAIEPAKEIDEKLEEKIENATGEEKKKLKEANDKFHKKFFELAMARIK